MTKLFSDPEVVLAWLDMLNYRNEQGRGSKVELVDSFFPLSDLRSTTYVGSFSWYNPKLKTRWLSRYHAYDYGAGWCSPADIARDYIAVRFPKRLRTAKSQAEALKVHRMQPLMAIRGQLPDAVYFDIKSAYWQITRIVGWDVDYSPNRWLSVQSDVEDFPFDFIKLARNCLVTIGLDSSITVWDGFYLKRQKKPNKFLNLRLWCCIQDVLRGVAGDMLKAGAKYINTDGYIFERSKAYAAEQVAADWGLLLKQKHDGKCSIFGIGAYEFESHPCPVQWKHRLKNYSNLTDQSYEWLQKRFVRYAANRDRERLERNVTLE